MLWRNVISYKNGIVLRPYWSSFRSLKTSQIFRENHYEVLGVKKDATLTEIKNAYFKLSKVYHPDRIAATDETLAKFRAISAAYEVLGNEHSRRLYDQGLISHEKGYDDDDMASDQLVKFYKERHERGKPVRDAMYAWTQEFYETSRKNKLRSSDILSARKDEPEDIPDLRNQFIFTGVCCFLIVLGVKAHTEFHPLKEFLDSYFK